MSGRAQPARGARTPAEWVTFVVSCLVLAVVVALIALQPQSAEEPAGPIAHLAGPAMPAPGGFQVPVEVVNEGGDTAADVQVTAELTIDGEVFEADQVIDFLAGDETEDLVFVFLDDPADGDLVVRVSGFSKP